MPVADDRPLENGGTNHAGLVEAFRLAAAGRSDAEIAGRLNAAGYRTTGNRGANLWRKDTVRRLLTNRFYLGELPIFEAREGRVRKVQVGWTAGRHPAVVDKDVFERAQRARQANRTAQRSQSVNNHGRTYSLTGLLRCWYCEQSGDPRRGKFQISQQHGTVRTYCYSRSQGLDCPQRGLQLAVYERQIEEWLAGIEVPAGALERALAQLAAEARTVDDAGAERHRLEGRLVRVKELYSWGDMDRAEYLNERDRIQQRLRALAPESKQKRDLSRLAEFVRGAAALWASAGEEGGAARNKLLVRLVSKVVVQDDRVVEIIPRPEVSVFVAPWQPSSWSGGSDGGCSRIFQITGPFLELLSPVLTHVFHLGRGRSLAWSCGKGSLRSLRGEAAFAA
ncbi:MAG: recombinase family protein [Chloroflexota bacterium]